MEEVQYNKIISDVESEHHNVVKYTFKKLNLDSDDSSHLLETKESDTNPMVHEESQGTKEVVTNELLDQIQNLLETVSSMQNNIDNHSKELQNHFDEDKKQSYNEGFIAGEQKIKNELNEQLEETKARLVVAIDNLNSEAVKISEAIKSLESELANVSVDIAKKVIDSELSEHSNKIALNLAKTLIKDLDSATEIKIKTSIVDYAYIKEQLQDNKKIKLEADEAIAKGGVIIVSEAGNIDGTIKERFEIVKSLLFNEE